MSANSPRNVPTIMCLTENDADEWTGSTVQAPEGTSVAFTAWVSVAIFSSYRGLGGCGCFEVRCRARGRVCSCGCLCCVECHLVGWDELDVLEQGHDRDRSEEHDRGADLDGEAVAVGRRDQGREVVGDLAGGVAQRDRDKDRQAEAA